MDIYRLISRRQILTALACLALAAVAFSTAVSGAASLEASASARLLPIYSVGREESQEKQIAISFDAAWGNEDTQKILDTLKANDVKVTFFATGGWVEKYPEDVKRIIEAGHDFANHSENHKQMSTLSEMECKEEIMKVHERVTENKNLKNGAIILCHSGAKHTAQALDAMIKNLKAKGFEFVPISQLIYKENYHMEADGTQVLDL